MPAQILAFGNVYTLEYRKHLLHNIGEAQLRYIELTKEAHDCPWWRPGKKTFLLKEAALIMRNIKIALDEYRLQCKHPLILMTRVTTR